MNTIQELEKKIVTLEEALIEITQCEPEYSPNIYKLMAVTRQRNRMKSIAYKALEKYRNLER